jgi:hypothetical protein
LSSFSLKVLRRYFYGRKLHKKILPHYLKTVTKILAIEIVCFFITLQAYLTFLVDTNLTLYSLVHKKLILFLISRILVIICEIKAFTFYLFNSA